MIGRTILHYQIVETLGRGGMGVVYKAKDTHLERFVAIKVLPPEKVADPERKRRFVQEAKAASALNHPNIVHIYDIAEADGIDYIAMEYVPSHIHNFYFRIDLDIDGQYPHDVCEIFNHNNLNDPGGDKWDVVPKQMKLLANPGTARKWRVRSTTSKLGAGGEFRSYEIEVPQLAGRDQFSTGDVWVTVYRGDGVQQ